MYNRQNLPLSAKKIIKKSVLNIWPALILMLTILPFITFEPSILIARILLTALTLVCFIGITYEYYYYKLYYYNFTDEAGEIRKGVISKATGHVRYERLQNIYIDQDVLDRIFGLYDVHYETAGERSDFYSHVDGLNKENAEKLVQFLNEKARNVVSLKGDIPQQTERNGTSSVEEGEKIEISRGNYPISSKVIWEGAFSYTIMFSVLLMGLMLLINKWLNSEGISSDTGFDSPLLSLLILVIAILSFVYHLIWFRNFYFSFGQERGEIRSKVLQQTISYFYYDRIQNVNINQSLLGRFLGIFTIAIETAGERGSFRLVIPGLTQENSTRLKDFILEKAKTYRGRL